MTYFVANGPDIPEHLLQEHEDGNVVFFCGAGISIPAGLPDFKGLVDSIYEQLGTPKQPAEAEAYNKGQYDATLHQLERRFPGTRVAVRGPLSTILKPKWRRKDAFTTHRSLLQLATDRKGTSRIVTTNFDQIFQRLITKEKLGVDSFAAPLLPLPKPSRWDGIVYLHGLLPGIPNDIALNRLVISSGDFGLAYLTERWAARFVSTLFQNYIICFVGYGVNDPVFRYMMDALAADELLGEKKSEAYSFASFSGNEREKKEMEWNAKGITPLLYEVPENTQDHSALHKTLRNWADTYRDGVRGKEMIIAQHATTPPLTSSRSDFAVGRVLWALTDGLAARRFADLNPVPPLEWLGPLTENQFEYQDLPRFGITVNNKDKESSFSILHRPSPYTLSPWMCIVDSGVQVKNWDEAMFQLARWLTRYLDDPKLIIWIAERGGQVHEKFAGMIQRRIEELDGLANDGKHEELDRIRANAPKAIPDKSMRTLWRLLLAKRLKSHSNQFAIYDWLKRIKHEGVTPSLRIQLQEILAPKVKLGAPFHWGEDTPYASEPSRIIDLVGCDLVLSSDHVHSVLQDLTDAVKKCLSDLLQDFTLLLRDALDLKWELGEADEKSDLSYIHQPSVSDHPQNSDLHDWTALIKLTRDAWLETAQNDHAQAHRTTDDWWQIPYPIFKRLALFAAAQPDVISPQQALDWLLDDDCWWLWSLETQRESLRLLVTLMPKLVSSEKITLEKAILEGPPRRMYKTELNHSEWQRVFDQDIWLHLARLRAGGFILGQAANIKLDELSQQYPEWHLSEDEREEFPFWVGDGEWNEEIGRTKILSTPRQHRELVEWLREHDNIDNQNKDDWRERCRDDFPTTTGALCTLAREGVWPVSRWRLALQAWLEDKLLKQSWSDVGPLLRDAPDDIVQSLARGIARWLQAIAKTFESHEIIFIDLCHRVLKADYQDVGSSDGPVTKALNHPVGYVTEALLRWWYRESPENDQGLPETLKPIFTELCNTRINKFRHGRVLLAAHIISVYRVDRDWTTRYLIPHFDWQRSETDARSAWSGFLWSPRLYSPLLSAIKEPMLETVKFLENLRIRDAERYVDFLTFAALDSGDTFTTEEFAEAMRHLPNSGLERVAQTLTRALEGSGEQRSEYWRNRLVPYLRKIWPQSNELRTSKISENLALLCINAGDAFPEALNKLLHWLIPIEYPSYQINVLYKEELCKKHPADALKYLEAIVGQDAQWLTDDLRKCLNDIKQADQTLAADIRFKRLDELYRRQGM